MNRRRHTLAVGGGEDDCRSASDRVATREYVTQGGLGAAYLVAESLNRTGQPEEFDAFPDCVLLLFDSGLLGYLVRYAVCGATVYAVSTMRG